MEAVMGKIYFPGANTGCGFVSHFSGIVPSAAEPHYTYVLKGGPGVGKNTLMRTVAARAEKKGMTVEEFHCASDPDSFDAVRVDDLSVVLLDGTAPHSIDPVLPGIDDEVVDLGHFKDTAAFGAHRAEAAKLFALNKACYNRAYALLGAARLLKREAILATAGTVDFEKLRSFLSPLIASVKKGKKRELFARSATPKGTVDYSVTYLPSETVYLSGILGEIALSELVKMLDGAECTVGYDFVDPTQPRTVCLGNSGVAIGEGETLIGLCESAVPKHVTSFIEKSENLANEANAALAEALSVHDRIEELYRDYVDYDRVNHESEILLKKLGL